MNTPFPCNLCVHLYYDCMVEDDPDYMAECKLGRDLGDTMCTKFKHWHKTAELAKINQEKKDMTTANEIKELEIQIELLRKVDDKLCELASKPLDGLSDTTGNKIGKMGFKLGVSKSRTEVLNEMHRLHCKKTDLITRSLAGDEIPF